MNIRSFDIFGISSSKNTTQYTHSQITTNKIDIK